ncbi:unnamed protein product [Calicophoron daubneyi]|uniref:SP-RING-type domain-containing protein n=1 Tax=Calicophoron daubneyi TaxID=300641 RepID=A0AAV2U0J9_CALDB
MSGPNFPNGPLGPGFSLNFYRSDLRPSGQACTPSGNSRLLVSSRNSSLLNHPNGNSQSHSVPVSAPNPNAPSVSVPNLTVITSGVLPAAVSGFQPQAVLNNFFHSLLRSQTPVSSLPMPAANVSGYMNTIATNGRFILNSKPSPNPQDVPPAHASAVSSTQTVPPNNLPQICSTFSTSSTKAMSASGSSNRGACSSSSITMLQLLFQTNNLSELKPVEGRKEDQLRGRKLSSMGFLRWASICTRSFHWDRLTSTYPRCQVDIDALQRINWIVAPICLLGIYSESPFLRPVLLLRRVQFAVPGNPVPNFPDPDNMVRTLRELADAKVTKNAAFAPNYPSCASAVGFTTGYLTYVFTLDLDRLVVKLLIDRLRLRNSTPDWRVVLRLGWGTSDFYVPPSSGDSRHLNRALTKESLPRCLSVRVAGKGVSLPDPIFHGGQAQQLGRRLRLSIDITDKIPIRMSTPVRNKLVDVEITWLHAPLEDQSVGLLDLVAGGQISPILCHLIGLPLIQATLDRAYTIPDLITTFQEGASCVLDRPASEGASVEDMKALSYREDGVNSDAYDGVYGLYDNCLPPCRCISADSTKNSLQSRFQTTVDDDLCITDGDTGDSDYIPICLLCPLTRTRIGIPVRSVVCKHLQCFDLTSYLTINRRRPRWTCPICSALAPFRDLRRDELFASILNDPSTVDATFIHVNMNGEWRISPEEDAENNVSVPAQRLTEPEKVDTVTPPVLPSITDPTKDEPMSVEKADTEHEGTDAVAVSQTADRSAEVDVEVIVLSDDDADEKQQASAISSPKKSVEGELLRSELESRSSAPVTRCIPANSFEPTDTVEIDLTNDDSDHSCESNAYQASNPSTSLPTMVPSPLDGLESNNAGFYTGGRLKNRRPLIVLSPLSVVSEPGSPAVVSQNTVLSGHKSQTVHVSDKEPNVEHTSESISRTEPTNKSSINGFSDTLLNRRLFETFSPRDLSHSSGSVSSHSSGQIGLGKLHIQRDHSNGSGSWKKKASMDKHTYPVAKSNMNHVRSVGNNICPIRPVASYLDGAEDRVPGLDLFDFSDCEQGFVPDIARTHSRHQPVVKKRQAVALAQLMRQRATRNHHLPGESPAASTSTAVTSRYENPALPSTSRRFKQTASNASNISKRRRRSVNDSDDTQSYDESVSGSELSDNDDSPYTPLSQDSDESFSSYSSDDRWSPHQWSSKKRTKPKRLTRRRFTTRR